MELNKAPFYLNGENSKPPNIFIFFWNDPWPGGRGYLKEGGGKRKGSSQLVRREVNK